MKKLFSLVLISLILVSPALAEVDLSGLSFDELVALRAQVDAAIWASDGWQEVIVPTGTYMIGRDIPAGYWTIRPVAGQWSDVAWGPKLDESGIKLDTWSGYAEEILISDSSSLYSNGDTENVSWDLKEGTYIVIEYSSVVFTPFTGFNFGFK